MDDLEERLKRYEEMHAKAATMKVHHIRFYEAAEAIYLLAQDLHTALHAEREKHRKYKAIAEQAATRSHEKVKTLRKALDAMYTDYRTEGCPDPSCGFCKRSKAAENLCKQALKDTEGTENPEHHSSTPVLPQK